MVQVVLKEVEELSNAVLSIHNQCGELKHKRHKAKQKLEPTCRWITDLLDHRAELRDESCWMEQDLKRRKEDEEMLEASGMGLGLASG